MNKLKSAIVTLAIPVLPALLVAQQPAALQPTAQKHATAIRVASGAINLDGKLTESVWATAPALTDFVQKDPIEGGAPSDRVEVRFAYDDAALFVGIRVFSKDPQHIQSPISRRDNIDQAEYLLVSLDTYLDHRTAYSFAVTASGVRGDWYHPVDNESSYDQSFDPVWDAQTHPDSLGWTAEMRIPFSQLRFNATNAQTWGVNIDHWIPARNENDYWSLVSKKEQGWASRFGVLEGIEGIKPSRRLELMPYVAADATLNGDRDRRNPFDNGSNVSPRVGGDLKMGLGPALTLAATVNPDFGQVEADPAEVNLSAFETFFSEKRPFFVEGSQLLRGNGASYFYSRRIGARPRGGASGSFVDYPNASTILGAAKITGNLRNGTSVGLLAAVTDREYARTFDLAANHFGKTLVAPMTEYGVSRLQRQFGSSASTVGLSQTVVQRNMSSGSPLAALLDKNAYTGGADMDLRWAGGKYDLRTYLGYSVVSGDTLAIAGIQQSSAHYWQRPDAKAYHYDPSRTSMFGFGSTVQLNKNGGKHWLGNLGVGTESPGFELNDLGRLGTGDGKFGFGFLRYRETQPNRLFRNYGADVSHYSEWNYDNNIQTSSPEFDADVTFRNFWGLSFTTFHNYGILDERLTRGGPLMGYPSSNAAIINLYSSSASKTRWNARVYYGKDEFGAPLNRLSGSLSIRPGPRWQFSAEPNYLRAVDSRQYVATLDNGSAATYGKRYVFSWIDRSTFLTDFRMNFTVKPDLTLEMYAEPFAASGRYYRIGELDAPRSFGLRTYGTDGTTITQNPDKSYSVTDTKIKDSSGNPSTFTVPFRDFNVRSWNSNTVIRWEYRPGSTLYLVWQQSRGSQETRGNLVGLNDLFGGLSATGTNFFAVKASYWIPAL
jgi:hypothetical protein